MTSYEAIRVLKDTHDLPDEALCALFMSGEGDVDEALFSSADRVRRAVYGDEVYLRGLIEFTNHCKNNCYYCGIRRDNRALSRYRLSGADILSCCEEGYRLGFRTFVLQGGEDPFFTDEVLCPIVSAIHRRFPDCAVTLSVGERSFSSYKALHDAGARRYLLRHETADEAHYQRLHPASMSLEGRKKCLFDLKAIGYQVGSGFMVGSPGQRMEHLVADLRFLQALRPAMIGIGPYLSHRQTPFAHCENGSYTLTLRLISVLRLMFPYALIPATTAMGTIHPEGREAALRAGANVVMPNLSPLSARKRYELYDNKLCTGEEAASCRAELSRRVSAAGYRLVSAVGDAKDDGIKEEGQA